MLKRKTKTPLQPRVISPLIVGPFLRVPHYKKPRPVADFLYEEVENTEERVEPKLKVILLKTIDELGIPGDVVEVERDYGRFQLISAQAAVYASEYNLSKYRNLRDSGGVDRHGPSSAFVMPTVKRLKTEVILVWVNGEHPWTINKRMVRVAFRAAGYVVPEECIRLPETPISGPDVEGKQGKDFACEITINGVEKVHVRCMIQHVGQPLRLRWQYAPRHVLLEEEQGQLLDSMPLQVLESEDYF